MNESTQEAAMLYIAALLLALAIALIGADYAGVRAAHHAGVTGTLFLLLALALVVAKEIQLRRRHSE
jgi:hypothetical protein